MSSCNFKKGEIVRCKNTGVIYLGTGTALRKFDTAGWNAVRAKRAGLSYRDASCSNIASCKKGEPATASNLVSNLALIDVGPMAIKTATQSKPVVKPSAKPGNANPGTCKFEKGVFVYCMQGEDASAYVDDGANKMWSLPRAMKEQVQIQRPGLKPILAQCTNIAACGSRGVATTANLGEILALIDAGPMKGFTRPSTPGAVSSGTSAPGTSAPSSWTSKPPSCYFEKGALTQCMGEGPDVDWYIFDGSKQWTIKGADAKAALVQSRPGLKPAAASCDQIVSCPSRGIATPSDMPEILALIDGGPMLRPSTLAPGPTCQPATTGAPVLPVCTNAPTDFEKTTCGAAGGKLVARQMYGQTFATCVFDGGASCQVEDLASGWCSPPTKTPLTVAPAPPPAAQPPPWMQQAPNNNRQNALLAALPGLFGGAGSDVAGNDTNVGGGGSGLGYAAVGPGGAYAGEGLDPAAAPKFFGDETGMANTGVTPEIVAKLTAQQYDTSGNDRVPQPIPVVMPGTTPQGPPGDTGLATQAPVGATGGEEAAKQQIAALLAAATTAPIVDETAFFRLKNPIIWILVAALIAVVFIIYKRYSMNKVPAA